MTAPAPAAAATMHVDAAPAAAVTAPTPNAAQQIVAAQAANTATPATPVFVVVEKADVPASQDDNSEIHARCENAACCNAIET